MKHKIILLLILSIWLSAIAHASCTIELIPSDYENEKCLSLKDIEILVKEDSMPIQNATVYFALNTSGNDYQLRNNSLSTNSTGFVSNKVLFGNYGNATIAFSAEYNSSQCGSGFIQLSIGEELLHGTVFETNNNHTMQSSIIISHLYTGQIFYMNQSESYNVSLPVCNYIIAAFPKNSSYNQVESAVAYMAKDSPTQKDVYVTQELCNNLDDDNDGSTDEDFNSNYNNFGALGTSCKASDGICSGAYQCSGDGLSTQCSTAGNPCEFCYNINTDPDNDDDVYLGQCSYNGICMYNGFYPFTFHPLEKIDCASGCAPVTSDINSTAGVTCN